MRGLFWVILIAGLAVAVTVASRYNTGYVLFALHPYRVEMSLNFLAALLVLLFIAGYLVVRVIAHALSLPSQVRAFRTRRRGARAQRRLVEALHAFLEGRYAQAEKAANATIDSKVHAGIGAVIAARAAHELRAYDRRDRYLARASHFTADDQAMRVIAQAELLLQDRNHQDAQAALDGLPRKHTAALRLELRAAQQARNWDRCLEVLAQLEKLDAFEPARIAELRRLALCENLARKGGDLAALREYWQRLPQRDRSDPKVAAQAARRLIELGEYRDAQPIIEAALEREWDSELVQLYAECSAEDARRRIERAERWLVAHPSDAALLLTLGRLCARQRLWGKARSYFEASLSVEETFGATLALARLLEETDEAEAARACLRRSVELAEPLVQRDAVRLVSSPEARVSRPALLPPPA
jgi:HemY protein